MRFWKQIMRFYSLKVVDNVCSYLFSKKNILFNKFSPDSSNYVFQFNNLKVESSFLPMYMYIIVSEISLLDLVIVEMPIKKYLD